MEIDKRHAYEYFQEHTRDGRMQPDRVIRRYLSSLGAPQSRADEVRELIRQAAAESVSGGEIPQPETPAPAPPPSPPPTPPPEPEAPIPPAPAPSLPEPAMSALTPPVLVAQSRAQIEDVIDRAIPALLARGGAPDDLVNKVLDEFEDALKKTSSLCRRAPKQLGAHREIAQATLQDLLEDGGVATPTRDAVVKLLAATLDAATDTGALDDHDDTLFRAGFSWLAERADDLLGQDPKKLRARAARARARAELLEERATQIERG